MSRLFESFEELENNSAQRLLKPRQSFVLTLMTAFLVGGRIGQLANLIRTHRPQGDISDVALDIAIWGVFGVLFDRGAWRRLNE